MLESNTRQVGKSSEHKIAQLQQIPAVTRAQVVALSKLHTELCNKLSATDLCCGCNFYKASTEVCKSTAACAISASGSTGVEMCCDCTP